MISRRWRDLGKPTYARTMPVILSALGFAIGLSRVRIKASNNGTLPDPHAICTSKEFISGKVYCDGEAAAR